MFVYDAIEKMQYNTINIYVCLSKVLVNVLPVGGLVVVKQVDACMTLWPRLQRPTNPLPEQPSVAPGPAPAHERAALQELLHPKVRAQLSDRELFQKQQHQHVLLLIEQTETEEETDIEQPLPQREGAWRVPGHLDLAGAPLAGQVLPADHTQSLPAAVDGLRDVLHD